MVDERGQKTKRRKMVGIPSLEGTPENKGEGKIGQ